MFQLVYVPSLGVLVDIVWLTTLPFSNSIFTSDPTLPDDVHFIVGFVPMAQDSPPFGAVTVITGEGTGVGVGVGVGVDAVAIIKFVVDRVELPPLFEAVRLTV